MEEVNISLFWKGQEHPLVGLKLYGCEGTQELQKLVLVIEDSLKKNFPSVRVNRIKAVRDLFSEGKREGTMTLPGLETPRQQGNSLKS